MGKEQPLTIDLRHEADFSKSHLASQYKWVVLAIYLASVGIIGVSAYEWMGVFEHKAQIQRIQSEEAQLSSKLAHMHQKKEAFRKSQDKASTLIQWQKSNVHGQGLMNALLARLPKEVLLKRFSFRIEKTDQQALIILDLTGSSLALNEALERIPQKLETLGFKLVSLDQMEITEGLRLQYLCQLALS